MADELHLISPNILKSIQELKTNVLMADKSSLNCEEILTALTISAATNPSAKLALAKLSELRGCRAHCTAILSDKDENTLKALGHRRHQRPGVHHEQSLLRLDTAGNIRHAAGSGRSGASGIRTITSWNF